MQLSGKTAIVTGSTSGIGLGIAECLAKAGANVIINGFGSPEAIQQAKSKVEAAADGHGEVAYSGADMTKTEEIEQMVAEARERFGSVDIIVNNAGVQYTAPVEEFPVEKWDFLISLLLSSAFHTTRLTLPQMREKGWGRIINISSVHGVVASKTKAAYVSAKHGLLGLTKVAALENAGTGVTVNAICPGWVLTPLVQQQIDAISEREGISVEEATAKLLGEKQPSKQFATPEQLGELVMFLCGPGGEQMTGASLLMDGGWSAQ